MGWGGLYGLNGTAGGGCLSRCCQQSEGSSLWPHPTFRLQL